MTPACRRRPLPLVSRPRDRSRSSRCPTGSSSSARRSRGCSASALAYLSTLCTSSSRRRKVAAIKRAVRSRELGHVNMMCLCCACVSNTVIGSRVCACVTVRCLIIEIDRSLFLSLFLSFSLHQRSMRTASIDIDRNAHDSTSTSSLATHLPSTHFPCAMIFCSGNLYAPLPLGLLSTKMPW